MKSCNLTTMKIEAGSCYPYLGRKVPSQRYRSSLVASICYYSYYISSRYTHMCKESWDTVRLAGTYGPVTMFERREDEDRGPGSAGWETVRMAESARTVQQRESRGCWATKANINTGLDWESQLLPPHTLNRADLELFLSTLDLTFIYTIHHHTHNPTTLSSLNQPSILKPLPICQQDGGDTRTGGWSPAYVHQ